MVRTQSTLDTHEAAFLWKVFLYAFGLRAAAILILNAANLTATLAADASTYHHSGLWMMYHWKYGLPYPEYVGRVLSSHWGYAYFVGAIYYLLGEVPLLIQFTSAFFGACIPLVVYKIAKRLFDDRRVAVHASWFAVFLPSMIIWSSQILRDPIIVLMICLVLYAALQLMERFHGKYLVLLMCALFVLYSMRFYVAYLLFGCLVFAFVLGSWFLARGVGSQVVVGLVLLGLVVYTGLHQRAQVLVGDDPLARIQHTRQALAAAGSSFMDLTDVSTPTGAVRALPKGVVYFLLAPFPWQMASLRALLTAPEMLVWWWFMPITLRGVRHALGLRPRPCLLILSFIIVLSLLYALVEGNAGVAFRHRAQIICVVFIFTSLELALRQQRQSQMAARFLQRQPTFCVLGRGSPASAKRPWGFGSVRGSAPGSPLSSPWRAWSRGVSLGRPWRSATHLGRISAYGTTDSRSGS